MVPSAGHGSPRRCPERLFRRVCGIPSWCGVGFPARPPHPSARAFPGGKKTAAFALLPCTLNDAPRHPGAAPDTTQSSVSARAGAARRRSISRAFPLPQRDHVYCAYATLIRIQDARTSMQSDRDLLQRMRTAPPPGTTKGPDPKVRPLCQKADAYLMIFVTVPAPTVRPPSRMAKPRPSSMAIGWISSTVTSVVSPGMTISVPSGSVMTPVTSVVRK